MSIEASEGRLRLNADAFARSEFLTLRLTLPVAVAPQQANSGVLVRVSLPAGDFIGARQLIKGYAAFSSSES